MYLNLKNLSSPLLRSGKGKILYGQILNQSNAWDALLGESKGGEQSYQSAKHGLECLFLCMSQLL